MHRSIVNENISGKLPFKITSALQGWLVGCFVLWYINLSGSTKFLKQIRSDSLVKKVCLYIFVSITRREYKTFDLILYDWIIKITRINENFYNTYYFFSKSQYEKSKDNGILADSSNNGKIRCDNFELNIVIFQGNSLSLLLSLLKLYTFFSFLLNFTSNVSA